MNRTYWLFAAPLLIGAGPPVDPETRKDLRCLIAVSTLGDNPEPSIAMAGVIGAQYYLGRIDGRAPGLDLEAAMVAETSRLTAVEIPQLLVSCGGQIKARGEDVAKIGKRMQEKAASAPPSSS